MANVSIETIVMGQQASAQPTSPDSPDPNPEVAWWCKLLSRGIASLGAIIAVILGVMCFATSLLKPICIVAAIIQIVVGLLVLIIEAPICCTFVECTKPVAAFAKKRTFWQKGILYVLLAIPAIAMCFGVLTLCGSGLVFAAGVFYGLMGLGKKADREDMLAQASGQPDYMKLNLVNNEESPMQGP